MGKINEQHLLDEIRFDIGVKDLKKCKLVLAALGHVSRDTKKQALNEVMSADDSFAIPLHAGFVAENPDLVIHSLNVLGDLGDRAAIAPIRHLLFNEPKDPNIRFVAYETLGRLR